MKLKEIAERIHAYLTRFEASPEHNPSDTPDGRGLRPYYHAWAAASGAYVAVCYITYQGHSNLTRAQAEAYLARLDAGFVGRHHEALRGTEHDVIAVRAARRRRR